MPINNQKEEMMLERTSNPMTVISEGRTLVTPLMAYCPRCGVIESSCICNYILSRERMQRKHRATRPVDRCGFRSTLVAAVGVYRRNVEQGGRTTADQDLAAQSFSSGDGLGIQQPGSNTWGGLLVPTAPSGRADESAMCPAGARSFEGRAG